MAIKIQKLNFKNISHHNILRNDFKYFQWISDFTNKYKNTQKLKYFVSYSYKGYAFEAKDFSTEGEIIALKGANFQEDFFIDFDNMDYLPEEFYDMEKFKKFKVQRNEIVIALVGHSIGKIALIRDDVKMLLNQNNISIKLKEEYNSLVYTYIISIIIKEVVEKLYKVSGGYSFLRVDDLMDIQIPILDKNEQDYLLDLINKYENSISKSRNYNKIIEKLINEVITKEFCIDIETLKKIENKKNIDTDLYSLSFNNSNLRASYRWNKAVQLQEKMFLNCNCIEKLGKYIINTKNGWSPTCDDNATTNIILGIDCININTSLSFDSPKYSDESKDNINNDIIKNGDLFVSRGNTVNLVALASIAKLSDEDEDYIFSDLMIRINLNDDINKEYVAYIINSIIGRLYFKYVSKGKNQSMVKISSKELNDFLLPVPNKAKQKEVVDLIKAEIDKQDIIKQQLIDKRNELENIIRDTIKEN
ncbi:restriction endonuclease subunit S [Clostridium beijerinckii]|uniref:restriction endonuclease subunit S n=1 Tax=Clostridium beijerinckii TaxID=1520 RepID=UPI00047966B3|nr:restriction endonuclease subunit S [Clostridium beijerinckii]